MVKYHPLFLLLLFSSLFAQAQTWQWAHSGGGSDLSIPDAGYQMVISPDGKIYSYGIFTGGIVLDSLYYESDKGQQFLAKYNGEGEVEKVIFLRGSSQQSGAFVGGMGCDHAGHIFLTGDIEGTVLFGDTLFSGSYVGYLANFDPALKCKWVKKVADGTYGPDFDNQNNIYVCGAVNHTISYIDTFELSNFGRYQKMFYAKLDTSGKCLWVKQGLGSNSFLGKCVSQSNATIFLGYLDSCTVIDTANICPSTTYKPTGVLINVDTAGGIKWYSKSSSGKAVAFSNIGVDAADNFYALGWLDSTVSLGTYSIEKTAGFNRSYFLVKYNSAGSVLWLKKIDCNTDAVSQGISTDAAGNTYIAGTFSGTAVFGSNTVTAQAAADMFIVRYNNNGDFIGAVTVPNALCNALVQDSDGNVIVTGSIKNGPTNFGSIALTGWGIADYFIAKLSAITGATALQSVAAEAQLKIYPNPNAKAFNIDVPEGLLRSSTAQLGIYNSTGSLIKQEPVDISSNRVSVDIGTVQKGIYTVILSSGTKKFTGRVVVE